LKKLLIISFLIGILVSCKEKEENDPVYPTYILAGHSLDAGIQYTDIVPDDTLKIIGFPDTLSVVRQLDINTDSIPDFELSCEVSSPYMMGGSFVSVKIKPLGLNSVCTSKNNNHLADSLRYNDSISERVNWSDSAAVLYSESSFMGGTTITYGFFDPNAEYFVGLKIVKENQTYYGWLDLKMDIIRQFAITKPM
jgi:hypothetical protein